MQDEQMFVQRYKKRFALSKASV